MRNFRNPVLAALAVLGCLSAPAVLAKQPNIVLILSDDQAWTDYGFMGHAVIRTPHLDKLAEQSVVFTRGYVPTPLCRPSLMSLATGHYARDHGVTGNDPSPRLADKGSQAYLELANALAAKIDDFNTLPGILAADGYLAHQSGKWWEGNYTRGGFTHGMTEGQPGGNQRHGDKGLIIGRQGLEPVFSFIRAARGQGKPFYLWYAPFLPHTPHNPPQRILSHYASLGLDPDLARYYAMCEWFDETCGELIGFLDDNGLRDNTLIYYVCDNGWIQRTRDTAVPEGWSASFAPKSKQSVYDGGVRTPILFSWPGVLKPGRRADLVSSIDTFPTILAAAGSGIPDGLPGWNLLPYLQSGRPVPRDTVFGESYAHDIADINDPEASLLYLWCIRDRWKLILSYDGEVNRYAVVHPRDEPVQLFDILADPHETSNLAGSNADIVRELTEAVEAWHPLKRRRLSQAPSSCRVSGD